MPNEFMVEFSDLEDFGAVPHGMYVAHLVVTGQEQVEYGQQKGTPYVNLRFEIEEPEEYAGRILWQRLMLKGKGTRLTAELLRALGNEVVPGSSMSLSLYDMQGRAVGAQVAQREYNGQIQNEIKHFVPIASLTAV